MLTLLTAVYGLITRKLKGGVHDLGVWYAVCFMWAVLIAICAVSLNVIGWGALNILVAAIFFVVITYYRWRPANIALVVGVITLVPEMNRFVRRISGHRTVVELYDDIYRAVLKYGLVFFLVMGTFPLQMRFWLVFTAGIAALAISLLTGKTGIGKKVAIGYAVVVLAFAVWKMVPEEYFVKVFHVSPPTIGVTDADKMESTILKKDEENRVKRRVAKMKEVQDKVDKGDALTDADRALLRGEDVSVATRVATPNVLENVSSPLAQASAPVAQATACNVQSLQSGNAPLFCYPQQVEVPANGKSDLIKGVDVGQALYWKSGNSHIVLYNVYDDKTECRQTSQKCSNGALRGVYFANSSDDDSTAHYAIM